MQISPRFVIFMDYRFRGFPQLPKEVKSFLLLRAVKELHLRVPLCIQVAHLEYLSRRVNQRQLCLRDTFNHLWRWNALRRQPRSVVNIVIGFSSMLMISKCLTHIELSIQLRVYLIRILNWLLHQWYISLFLGLLIKVFVDHIYIKFLSLRNVIYSRLNIFVILYSWHIISTPIDRRGLFPLLILEPCPLDKVNIWLLSKSVHDRLLQFGSTLLLAVIEIQRSGCAFNQMFQILTRCDQLLVQSQIF